ncbi:MAG: glutamine--scyllo-inositol aminotransferase [Bacteroides sp. SM23_62]|nr:MAG: glutamine--scyllo-inositol aminotransferase [Bacteroides sp. SM23_62]
MSEKEYSRRKFLKTSTLTGLGVGLTAAMTPNLIAGCMQDTGTAAILGGQPVRTKGWPDWPMWDPETDEERVIEVLRSGIWSRGAVVTEFEEKWADTIGSKRCLATTNGTYALITALRQLNVGPGDEVLVPPYTFIATIDAILMVGAMPVFVDTDPATFQIDADKIEEKITSRTTTILPVHILGLPADMGKIMAIARNNHLTVLEDACQAWLAEIDNKKVGSFGDAGCFSFQNSKHIPIGEGGAIVSDNDEFMDRCFSFHNFGRPHGKVVGTVSGEYVILGSKCRMTEYQAAIGLAQLKRLEEQTRQREQNAEYLRAQIKDIPGILPYELSENVTRAVFHLFPFRYKKEQFHDLSRSKFMEALEAEGIPCSGGYSPLNNMPYLKDAFQSKNFQKVYSEEMLDFDGFIERNQCPRNDQLCKEAVWFGQNMLLGSKSDMDDIAKAIEKVHNNADKITKNA